MAPCFSGPGGVRADQESSPVPSEALDSTITTDGSSSPAALTGDTIEVNVTAIISGKGRAAEDGMCAVCHVRVSNLKRHVIKLHLPWFYRPDMACFQCQKPASSPARLQERHVKRHGGGTFGKEDHLLEWLESMKNFLMLEADCLGVPVEYLPQLVQREPRESGSASVFMTTLLEMLHIWRCGNARLFRQGCFLQAPVQLPTCPESVLHWDIQMELLGRMTVSQQEALRLCPLVRVPETSEWDWRMVVSDAHCHLQRVVKDFGVRKSDEAWAAAQRIDGFPFIGNVDIVVDNHVFAGDWGRYTHLQDTVVVHTVGVHPRLAPGAMDFRRLEQLAQHRLCVAIGECGLDETAADMAKQRVLFQKQVEWAVRVKKPLVLHLRGKDSSSSPQEEAIQICREIAPQGHPVYVHCYTGVWDVACKWQQYSRDVLFGFSWASTKAIDFPQLAAGLPLESITLESDAPYLSPTDHKPNTPFAIWHTAVELAKHRPLSVPLWLHVARKNMRRFYHI